MPIYKTHVPNRFVEENTFIGADNRLTVNCAARGSESDPPEITASAEKPVTLVVHWNDGQSTQRIEIGP